MNLSKDQQVKILLAVVIILLIALVLVMVSYSKNSDESLNENEKTNEIEFNLTPPEEEAADEEEGTAKPEPVVPPAQPAPAPAPAPAPTTNYTSGTCSPSLSGKKDRTYNGILLSWSTCNNEDFQFYKLVRSSVNSNPSYPNDPVVMSSGNRSNSSFIDKTVAARTTYYYKICVVQRLNKISCGNSVTVDF